MTNKANWIFPCVCEEKGEIVRVARTFNNHPWVFYFLFSKAVKTSELESLSEKDWGRLENTDSFEIRVGDWEKVREHAEAHEPKRDWQTLKRKMELWIPLQAPMIYRHSKGIHLVSGNTRLMVAKALGIEPKVLFIKSLY